MELNRTLADLPHDSLYERLLQVPIDQNAKPRSIIFDYLKATFRAADLRLNSPLFDEIFDKIYTAYERE